MKAKLLPLVREIRLIQSEGIKIWHDNDLLTFSPAIMYCSCDLPARSEAQDCKPCGYYSCPCCEQKGESVKNTKTGKSYVRLLKSQEFVPRRCHSESKRISIAIATNTIDKMIDAKGLKGLSCMSGFKHFDLVDSFNIDYMHGTLLGVLKLLLDFWMCKKPIVYVEDESNRFKMLNFEQRLKLNKRIIELKPPIRINHKPKSILERSFFTANEYRSLLWFYLRFALKGLLDDRLINHMQLLSSATYKLSRIQMTRSDLFEANSMLNQFADEFEKFYGRNSVTINVHLLRHYTDVVKNMGPLWCHSLFTFEYQIGVLKRLFCSKTDIVEQIAFNYCVRKTTQTVTSNEILPGKTSQILRTKLMDVQMNLHEILVSSGLRLHSSNQEYLIGYEMS